MTLVVSLECGLQAGLVVGKNGMHPRALMVYIGDSQKQNSLSIVSTMGNKTLIPTTQTASVVSLSSTKSQAKKVRTSVMNHALSIQDISK
jgi:hypothetical protein